MSDNKPLDSGLAELVSSVKYKDKDITTEKPDNKPRNLGFANLNENMEKVLQKHPNYSVYKKVTEDMVELSVEECLAKGRWGDLETQKDKDKEVSDTPSNAIFDPVEMLIDFHSVKATDLKISPIKE